MGRGTGGEQKWLAVVEEIWDNKEHFLGVLHGVTLKLCCCDDSPWVPIRVRMCSIMMDCKIVGTKHRHLRSSTSYRWEHVRLQKWKKYLMCTWQDRQNVSSEIQLSFAKLSEPQCQFLAPLVSCLVLLYFPEAFWIQPSRSSTPFEILNYWLICVQFASFWSTTHLCHHANNKCDTSCQVASMSSLSPPLLRGVREPGLTRRQIRKKSELDGLKVDCK